MTEEMKNLFADPIRREKLMAVLTECSDYALQHQEDITRSYKSDGTVLTRTDMHIHRRVTETLADLYPGCAVISEESDHSLKNSTGCCFVLDPIDGTDAYSQGMPSWCIALGIIDEQLKPVGGIVIAPRWGIGSSQALVIQRFPGEQPLLNGSPMKPKQFTPPPKQIVVCSGAHKQLSLKGLPVKLRTFGSSIIHILSPVIHSHIDVTVFAPVYPWDIAAAHGIIDALGLRVEYLSGEEIDYRILIDRRKTDDTAVAGTAEMIEALHNLLDQK